MQVDKWKVFEGELVSGVERNGGNPFWDVDVRVVLTSPGGFEKVIDAFWDGGQVWRFRFCPDEVGVWTWRSECDDEGDGGLHGQSGEFECVGYEGENLLYKHGAVRLSDDRRSLSYADGKPFFWLGDTPWNVALKGDEKQWEKYLSLRAKQGFTVLQTVTTNWRAYNARQAYEGERKIKIDPAFFQSVDPFFTAANEHGLVVAGVLLWSFSYPDPGQALWDEDAARLVRYQVARWGAYQVVWFLGGDGNYLRGAADRWKRIGRAVFAECADRLVTMHPGGLMWPVKEFKDEPWYDFIGYQSGHGDGHDNLRWLVRGPAAHDVQDDPVRPVINIEPNYEHHPAYQSKQLFNSYHIRRASWWSLLISPTAGVTYGHNHIWPWNQETGPGEGHPEVGEIQPWHTALETKGVESLGVLRKFMDAIEWWKLRPAQEVLVEQPGDHDVELFIAAARTEDEGLMLVYVPRGDVVKLKAGVVGEGRHAKWFDPRRGGEQQAVEVRAGEYRPPDHQDWLLVVE